LAFLVTMTTPVDASQQSDPASPPINQPLREWFDRAVDIPVDARAEWIKYQIEDAALRAALHRMLAVDMQEGPFDASAEQRMGRLGEARLMNVEGFIGTRIGAFRIERLLGEGGMATVFLGRRDTGDFDQQVALKLLRRGLYSEAEQRLFRREQRALATLSHPNIAHLLDGGITSAGVPYLVIEYIDGTAITEYAIAHSLDQGARLGLFAVVCDAVRAAHRALIVHRDLKPSNIFVDREGNVKLLDFGIAKLLDDDERDLTGTGHAALTPGYAAPEQYTGAAISTATDVYALGVVLHELLTGERPRWGIGATQITLRGDLGNIVHKALSEEPERRYASAHELALDIGRYLDAQPVAAHPPSTWYRTRKFVQRHRGGVVLGTATAIGLLLSLAITLWLAHEARQQAMRANTVRDVLIDVFEGARARLPRDQRPTPEALVAQAQRQLGGTAVIDPQTRIDLQRALAEVSLALSQFAEADAALAEAEAAARDLGDDAARIDITILRADGWQRAGDHARSIAALKPLMETLQRDVSPLLLRATSVLASATLAAEGPVAALAMHREAVVLAERRHGTESVDALAATLELGNTLTASELYPEAIERLTPALAAWRSTNVPEDDRYIRGLASLATANNELGNFADTESQLREVLELKRRIYPPTHDAIASTIHALGLMFDRSERHEQAEQHYMEALAMQRAVFGEAHRELASTHVSLAATLVAQRRFDDAESHSRMALSMCSKLALHDEICKRDRNNLGQMYYRQNRLVEAEREMTVALDERRHLLGADHPTIAYSLSTLANVAAKAGRGDDAARLSGEAVDHLERIGFGSTREAVLARNGYAQALRVAGRHEEAFAQIERAVAEWTKVEPQAGVRRVMMLVEKAMIERALGREPSVQATLAAIAGSGVAEADMPPRTIEAIRQLSRP